MARILIIDDEKQQLMLRATILRARGYEVETSSIGSEALALFRQQPFDIVITDWMMPSMTGLDITRQIKSLSGQTAIIMLTGWGSIIEGNEPYKEGVDCLLSKPCDVEKLIATIEKLLARSATAI